ncbi:MAG: FkbM family methyltransferase [Elusimicrobia bacterium]|nr:FkbM family methyltransferase [Elusimicrobiota bacterium]
MKRNIVFVAVCVVLIGFASGCSNLKNRREKSEFEIIYAAELRAARALLQDSRSKAVFDNLRLSYAKRFINGQLIGGNKLYVLPILPPAKFEKYFHPLVPINPGDTVIDAGSACGGTILQFIQRVGCAGRVIGFEPHPEVFRLSLDKLREHKGENAEVHQLALWNKNETKEFFLSEDIGGSTFILHDCRPLIKIEAVTIDYFVKTQNIERVDFIKLHVEGAEIQAFIGSENTLRRDKPNLAISIYHKPQHLFEIILWLNSLDIGYEFWMDKHCFTCCCSKIMLYARSKSRI